MQVDPSKSGNSFVEIKGEPAPKVEKQGWLGWLGGKAVDAAHFVADYTIFSGVDADKIIKEKSEELTGLMKSREFSDLIQTTLTDRLVNLINQQIPNQISNEWAKMGVQAALVATSRDVPKWVEATVFNLAVNFCRGANVQTLEGDNVLFGLLEFVAQQTNENLDEIKEKISVRDQEIKRIDGEIQALGDSDSDKNRESDLKLRIAEIGLEKRDLFLEMTKTLLAIACPNGSKDIALPSPMPRLGLDFKSMLYNVIEAQMPDLLLDLTTKMMLAGAKTEGNIEEIKKHPQGDKLIELVDVMTNQFHEVVSHALLDQGKETLGKKNISGLEKKIAELAQKLGTNTKGTQFNKLLRQLGTFCQPLLIHVFANLSRGMKEGDTRHVLTYILETYLEDVFHFAAGNKEILDARYQDYLEKVTVINKKYEGKLSAEELKQKEIELKDAFERSGPTVSEPSLHELFQIQAKEFLTKAGLDEKSLNEMLPYGASAVAEFVNDLAINHAFEFYRDVIVAQRALTPEKHPLAGKFKDFLVAHAALDKMVGGLIPSVKDSLQDSESGIGQILIDLIQDYLFIDKLPTDKKFFEAPIHELCDAPVFGKVEKFLHGYLRDTLITMMGNLALNFQGTGKLEQDALLNILKIIAENVKDPKLAEKLDAWKKMPSVTKEDKKAQADAKAQIMKSFQPCISALMQQGGLNNDANLLAPASKKDKVRGLLKDSVLPEVMFKVCTTFAVPTKLKADDKAKFNALTGKARLQEFGTKAVEMALPNVWEGLKGQGYSIASMANEGAAKKEMTLAEELRLGQNLNGVFANEGMKSQVSPFISGLMERILQFGLKNLAAKSPLPGGDALTNVFMHLRKRMAEQNISPKLVKKLETYARQTEHLVKLRAELTDLRKAVIAKFEETQNASGDDFELLVKAVKDKEEECKIEEQRVNTERSRSKKYEGRRSEIAQLKKEIEQMSQEIDIDLVNALGADDLDGAILEEQGKQESAIEAKKKELEVKEAELAVACSIETKHAKLAKEVEPFMSQIVVDMGLEGTIYETLAKKLLPDLGVTAYLELGRSYRNRAAHEAKLSPEMVVAAKKFAQFGLKKGDNWLVTNAEDVADKAAAALDIEFSLEEYSAKERKPGITGMGDIGVDVPGAYEFLMPLAQEEIYGQILEVFDGFIGNLKRIEANPGVMVGMTMDLIGLLTGHLAVANEVKGDGAIHEVDPAVLEEAFRAKGQLHAAMPGQALLNEINDLKAEIEANKSLPETVENKAALVSLLDDLRSKQAEVQKIIDDNFGKKFSLWFLNMAGKYKAEDLTLTPALQEKAWNLLKDSILPSALTSAFGTILSEDILNQSLATLVEKINANLGPSAEVVEGATPTPAIESNPADKEKMVKFLEQLAKTMPDSYMASMLNWNRIRTMSAGQLESVLKSSLENWPLSKIFETAMVNGADSLPSGKQKVTPEDLEAAKEASAGDNAENIAKFESEASRLVDQGKSKVSDWLAGSWWGSIINTLFGWAINWMFSKVQDSMKVQAPLLREEIVNVPGHLNFLFHAGDALMKHYKPVAPQAPVVAA